MVREDILSIGLRTRNVEKVMRIVLDKLNTTDYQKQYLLNTC